MNEEYDFESKLLAVFGANPPPAENCTDGSSWDAAIFIRSIFEGENWWDVSLENWSPDTFNEALYYFTSECLSYYFPVFLKWVIRYFDHADAARDSLIDKIEFLGNKVRFNRGEPFDIIDFSPEQSTVIRHFLDITREKFEELGEGTQII